MTTPNIKMVQESAVPTNKAVGATAGSALGTYIATIVNHMIESQGSMIPSDVEEAITGLIIAFVTILAAYFTPPGSSDGVMPARNSDQAVNAARTASIAAAALDPSGPPA